MTYWFKDLDLDNWLRSYDFFLNDSISHCIVCKVEAEEVVNIDASCGNSSFFSKLTTTCTSPIKGGQEEERGLRNLLTNELKGLEFMISLSTIMLV